jgi:thiamine-phosphate pyrophosphorylase
LFVSERAVFPNRGPIFYYVTDRNQLSGISLIACIRRALGWGVDFIQIREKDLPDRTLYNLTSEVVALARKTQCRVLVNGRADIALAAGAAGIHLPSVGLRASEIRSCFPPKLIIGASVHSIREARNAYSIGADYLIVGHVFPTESKSALGFPLGLSYLRKFCSAVSAPVLGLGGIRPESIKSVLDAGAIGVAGISLFQNDAEFKRLRDRIGESSRKSSSNFAVLER